MKIKYSPGTNGFYSDSINYGDSIPTDLIEVSDALYRELLEGQSRGKIITSNGNEPPRLLEQIIDHVAQAELKKQMLIDSALQAVSVIKLKLQIGRVLSSHEVNTLNDTIDYIDKVSKTDTSKAPDVEFPEFPVI